MILSLMESIQEAKQKATDCFNKYFASVAQKLVNNLPSPSTPFSHPLIILKTKVEHLYTFLLLLLKNKKYYYEYEI